MPWPLSTSNGLGRHGYRLAPLFALALLALPLGGCDSLGSLTSNLKLVTNGAVRVDIKARVNSALLARILALGGSIVVSVPRFDAIQADVPLDRLELLADEPGVTWIMPALGWVTNKVDTTQGDVAHKVDTTRTLTGLTGSGVTIGVLSDGVQTLAQRQASGDLPPAPQLQVLAGQAGSGDEGTSTPPPCPARRSSHKTSSICARLAPTSSSTTSATSARRPFRTT